MPKKPPLHRPFSGLGALKTPRPKPKTFVEAMKTEGTAPLREGVPRVPPAGTSRPRAAGAVAPAFSVEHEEDWVEGYRIGLAVSVRRRLGGMPTATLDLHRHDSDAARRRVARFVAHERESGRELVLVIVGRGRHSPGGRAVLRDEITEWLTQPPTSGNVLAFRTAPRQLGGSGAVVVLLRRPESGD